GQPQEPYDDLGDDPQCALGTDQQTSHIGAGLIHHFPPHLDDITVREDHFESQNMIARNAIFQTVHAASIRGDIATNGRDHLATRVRDVRIAVAVLTQQLFEILVDYPWLDHGYPVLQVDLEHPVHV